MNERTPPEGQPEPHEGSSPEPEPTGSGPIGRPERPAGSDAPTEATPAAGSAGAPAYEPPPAHEPPPAAAPPAAAAPRSPPPAQPAVQWQAPAPAAAMPGARPPRTTLSAIGGVALLALGIVGILFGALFLAGAAFVSQIAGDFIGEIPDVPDGVTAGGIVGGVIAFFAVLVLAYSVAYILGGIGVLRSAEWGRWLGIVVSVISGLIWASGMSSGSDGFGFAVVMFLIHLYVFFVLVFRWREPAVPVAA
ncbi:MAG: hypothetical protein FIA92_12825 [Chloroflexi bacterium]|nr:hypothetical protein [Chloroflexota bacterium]